MNPNLLTFAVVALGAAVLFAVTLARDRGLLEVRTRLLELFALATARGIALGPLLSRAAWERRGRTRRRLERMQARLKEGTTLSAACAAGGSALFPAHVLGAIRAAEGTAALPGALDAAARDTIASLHTRHRWHLALGYPLLLGVLFAFFFEALGVTRRMFGIGEELWQARAASLVLQLVAATLVAAVVLRLPARRLCVLRGPRLLASERLLRALAPHVAAQLPLSEALRRAAPACGNAAMAAGARDAARELEAGADLSRALPEIPLPRFALARLRLAREQSHDLYLALAEECARRYRDHTEGVLRWVTPLLLLAVGVAAALQFAGIMQFLDDVRRSILW